MPKAERQVSEFQGLAREAPGGDHPRAELLRYKGVLVGSPDIPRGMIHRAGFADWLVARATEAAPLVSWVAKKLD